SLAGMPGEAKNARVRHYRIDKDHSNSFEAWKRMGSPQQPTPEQYAELERAGKLAELRAQPSLSFRLPRQGVSLIELSW
ncbi:MAG: beta-xylosidase, partial [Bryobacteraceae bacterium]|nr:beta-xylosidase [Bryobacteraceae bacterium]